MKVQSMSLLNTKRKFIGNKIFGHLHIFKAHIYIRLRARALIKRKTVRYTGTAKKWLISKGSKNHIHFFFKRVVIFICA